MKRITCSLCGGTGVAYKIQESVEELKDRPVIAAVEKRYQIDPNPSHEEEEAWKALEKNLLTSSRL